MHAKVVTDAAVNLALIFFNKIRISGVVRVVS